MSAAGGADRSAAARRATRRRAIRVAAIARGADREEAAAPPTRFLAKRRVHDVGAATHSNWTRTSNRGTKRGDWLGPSEHRGGHRGSGGRSSRPSPRLPRQLTRPHAYAQAKEAVDADGSMDAQTRPQLLAKPRRRGFARAPTAIIFFVITRPERTDRREKSRFLRFYVASDTHASGNRTSSEIEDRSYAKIRSGRGRKAARSPGETQRGA